MVTTDGLILKARDFAVTAHREQVRDGTGKPYITHPANVATYVRHYWPDAPAEAVAAAWLHDTVEDTPVTLHDIHETFGPVVAALVAALTKPPKHVGNRATRTAMFAKAVALMGRTAAVVKLCDRLDNLRDDWATYSRSFARRYVRETGEALAAFGHHHPALALDVASAAASLAAQVGPKA